MANFDELIAAVTAEGTVEDSAGELLNVKTGQIATLKQTLADLLAGVTVPPAVQAKIDQAFQLATDQATKLAAAVVANTDVNTPPPVS